MINFILRKDYVGAEISGELAVTQHGGGNSGLVSAAYGFGDPARDGYNVFGVVSLQKQQALHGSERDSTKTSHRPDLGVSGLSPTTFPANIFDRPGRRVLNPTRADGCAPPSSLPFDFFGTPDVWLRLRAGCRRAARYRARERPAARHLACQSGHRSVCGGVGRAQPLRIARRA